MYHKQAGRILKYINYAYYKNALIYHRKIVKLDHIKW